MKKIIFLIFVLLSLFFSACSNQVQQNDSLEVKEFNYEEQEKKIENNSQIQEFLDEIKFNQNLTDYEQDWLNYLEVQNPQTKIYHMKTKLIRCPGCYDLSYKKDREIVIIQVRDFKKTMEKIVVDDIAVEIENQDICKLFKGTWNECPKLCTTDEEACNDCGLPVCEFDYNTIEYRVLGEECGGIDKGDCEYGLKCVYADRDDKYGVCSE